MDSVDSSDRRTPGRARGHDAILPTASPAAQRHRRPGWRDPRLALGVMIVAVSVLTGATLVGEADETARVWALARDVQAGETVAADDLVVAGVRFPSDRVADRYLPAGAAVTGMVLLHDAVAGELLPRAAVAQEAPEPLVEVPVVAAAEAVPATVEVGSVVDVWITPETPTAPAADEAPLQARLVLDDVPVVAVPGAGNGFAPVTQRQIIVGVDEAGQKRLAGALAALATGRTTVVKQR